MVIAGGIGRMSNLDDQMLQFASMIGALKMILIQKGIATVEELDRAFLSVQSRLDQEIQQNKDQWREENPEHAKVADLFSALDGDEDARDRVAARADEARALDPKGTEAVEKLLALFTSVGEALSEGPDETPSKD